MADLVDEIIKKFDACQQTHSAFVRTYERRERAYRGVLNKLSRAGSWKHQTHTPYVFNLIETIVANTIEEGLTFQARPAPHVNPPLDEALKMIGQAQAVEYLLRHEHRVDKMDDKQRPLFLTDAIGGVGVGKCYWNWTKGAVTRQGVSEKQVWTDEGVLLGTVPTIQTITEQQVIRDHSTFEVVDPRDFIMHQSARTLQPFSPGGAQYVFHRCWYSMEQLRMLEASGFIKNVDQLSETRDQTGAYRDRSFEIYEANPQKDLVEVLEYWALKDGQVVRALVGQRKVLLRDIEPNPFWHGGYPFVLCTSLSQPFSPRGVSQVELIEELQNILWELQNQRLDNIELINNAIVLIQSDVDDPESFEHYPGARWPVQSPQDVQFLQPPYQISELTLSAESQLKGDLQNVTSAVPFAGGVSSNIDQQTATGVSIIMTNAQKALQAKKYQSQKALRDEANIRLKNCQQFIRGNRTIQILGSEGATDFLDLSVMDIQGEWAIELTPVGESMNRQERRSEAMQLIQVLGQMAPLLQVSGSPLDMKAVVTWALKRWGIDYADEFFTEPGSQPALPPGGGSPQQTAPGGGGSPPGGPNLGITADSAVSANSPSAPGGISGSPVTALHRALSMSGGVANH